MKSIAVLLCLAFSVAAQGYLVPASSSQWPFAGFYVETSVASSQFKIYAQFHATGGGSYNLLSCFNLQISNPPSGWYHDDLIPAGTWDPDQSVSVVGGTWYPQYNDSYVCIGGPVGGLAVGMNNATAVDPNFGSWATAQFASNAGWYSTNPSSQQGLSDSNGRVEIGTFIFNNIADLDATNASNPHIQIFYNQGGAGSIASGHFYFYPLGEITPVAAFTGTPTSGTSPLIVNFTDQSANTPTSWSWDFGDGTTSIAQSPSHVYTAPGTYSVSLTASNGAGSDTIQMSDYITVSAPVWSYFANQASNGDTFVGLVAGQPSAPYHIFQSPDPLNAISPGTGALLGLHISLFDVWAQFGLGLGGNALFAGNLNANGEFSMAIAAPGVAFLSGQTWWGMGIQVTPSTTGLYDPTDIQSVTFQ